MIRKFLLPALAIATLAGCATGYSYRGGNGDYYYSQPSTQYRYYGGYGFGYGSGGFGMGYYVDIFGRPVYGYPYGYYGWGYPAHPYGHGPRPRPPHGPGHGDGGHDGDHDDDHDGPPMHGPRPGNRPPWRDIGGIHERGDQGDQERERSRRFGQQPDARPMVQRLPPPARPQAPVMRERSESRPAGMVRGGGSGERSRVRSVRPSANE